MTTKEAAAQYETAHVQANKDKKIAVYNPHNKPISELPVIYQEAPQDTFLQVGNVAAHGR